MLANIFGIVVFVVIVYGLIELACAIVREMEKK